MFPNGSPQNEFSHILIWFPPNSNMMLYIKLDLQSVISPIVAWLSCLDPNDFISLPLVCLSEQHYLSIKSSLCLFHTI